jgi:hypothetical protein
MIIFIKPTISGKFLCAAVCEKTKKIEDLQFAGSLPQVVEFVDTVNSKGINPLVSVNESTSRPVHSSTVQSTIFFCGSLRKYEGFDLRVRMPHRHIILYRGSGHGTVHKGTVNAVLAHKEWISKNIVYSKALLQSPDFIQFQNSLLEYDTDNSRSDGSAAEMMADIARELRKNKYL